ncbi:TrbI/VirB10 family protein [Desulfovibrio ferrophilus]|uniref:COMB3 protein n=1 Tax=Desulfovibrio ferrophilus TaxID=241368 RepID=A0A2Z6B3U6_9BACT|nr:TrbI/VirB10 family protein [Desulfovibrio ferrophilus]BBD10151.1 COMB3 protein [Desulfovibrio ferrophilus]
MARKAGPARIKNPSRFRGLFLWGGLVAVVTIASIALILAVKSNRANEPKDENIIEFSDSADSVNTFFPSIEEETTKEPEPKAKPKPKPRPKPIAPPPAPKRPALSDIFNFKPTPKPAGPTKADEINSTRRGAVAVRFSSFLGQPGSGKEPEPTWKNSQEDWAEEKTVTSYPIDMSRTLTVDRNIRAILINEIRSDLEGKVVAQVEHDVFGAHGRNVLVPAGSKAVGRYKPLEKVGMERLKITWVRFITPDGINIHTADAEMADSMGRSGTSGQLDRRYYEKFGTGLLVSSLGVLASYTMEATNENQAVAIEQFGNSLANMTNRIVQDNLDIKPRLTIPAGTRILISPSRDIWFPKPIKNSVKITALEDKKNDK